MISSVNFCFIFLFTIKKSGAIQVCPQLINFPQTILFAVTFIEAVSSTIHGFLPPSSRVVGVKFTAANLATIFPKLTLPVKYI